MEDKCDYGSLYKLGKYGLCLTLLEDHNPKTEIDTCVLANNRLVCSALKLESKELNQEKWKEVLYAFVDLHAAYRCVEKVPLFVELNIVYNLIWWYSSKLWNFEQRSVFEGTVLEAVSGALMKVLNVCKDISVISEFEVIDMNFIVILLKNISGHMLRLTPLETIQMLDIYTGLSHLVLKREDEELTDECLEVLDNIVKHIEIIKLHLTSNTIKRNNDKECFKFGLSCVNNSSSLDNYQSSLEAFMLSGSILGIVKHNYRAVLKYLHLSEICGDTESYKYIRNYFKAFCHMKLDEYNEAELHLSYISQLPMDNERRFYYFLLLGKLYSHRQEHDEAMKEFHNAIETGYNTSSALMLTIMELQALSQPVMQLILLEKLVDDLSSKSEFSVSNVMKMCTLEDHCLTSMYKEFEVTLPEALYIFARHAFVSEHYSLSLELYLNLLKSIRGGCLLEYNRERRLVPLPSTAVITHEAILAHLECMNLTEAEQLCITAIDDYFPSSHHSKEVQKNKFVGLNLEGILFSMEEDVFVLILLADIKIRQKNYSSANNYLDRCSNAVIEHEVIQKGSSINSSDTNEIFLKYLLGRIYLRKARISEVTNEINNTYHYYKRAIMYAPGDEEIVFKYKSWLVRNNIDDSVTVTNENHFPFLEMENITLRYILTYSVDKTMPLNDEKPFLKEEEVSSKEEVSNKEENFVADVGDLFDDEIIEYG